MFDEFLDRQLGQVERCSHVNNPRVTSCHIVSHCVAAKGPEPPGPLITGTQMGLGGDLPRDHEETHGGS